MDQGWVVFWAVAGGFMLALVHAFACWWWPYTSCRRCGGGGRFRSPTGKAWRHCGKCKGSGSRVRLGRRMWTKLGVAKDKLIG